MITLFTDEIEICLVTPGYNNATKEAQISECYGWWRSSFCAASHPYPAETGVAAAACRVLWRAVSPAFALRTVAEIQSCVSARAWWNWQTRQI